MVNKKAKEDDWQDYSADIRNIKDNQIKSLMREQLSKDVQTAVRTLDIWEEDVIRNLSIDRVFEPEISEEERIQKLRGWNKAVKYSYGWAKED